MRSPDWLTVAASGVVAALVGCGVYLASANAAAGEAVRGYILAHPDIVTQAMQELQDRATGRIIKANAPAILTPFGDAWAGNPKGDVTMVEYFDYNCGYCRASLPTIAALLRSDPNVRIVYRELPILSEASAAAARLSLAAADQGRFAAFHAALYAAGPLSPESMAAAARATGVDTAKAAAMAPRADAEIAANLQMARQLGMTGTPSWVIGDRVVSAALPLGELRKAIADARASG